MKPFGLALAAILISCGVDRVLAQTTNVSPPATPQEVGTLIVEAIERRNIQVFSRLVMTPGVTVGVDGPTIPAATFIRQLQQKRGVYCILMEGSCIKGGGEHAQDGSLRGLILRQPIEIDIKPVDRFPKTIEVIVHKKTDPREVLFNLFLEQTRDGWRLESIEYD